MPKTKASNNRTKSASSRAKKPIKPAVVARDRKSSKSDAILALLRRKQGASLEEMQKISGWQKHSVRGYLSGTVKKRLGLTLNSSKAQNGERRYMIAAG